MFNNLHVCNEPKCSDSRRIHKLSGLLSIIYTRPAAGSYPPRSIPLRSVVLVYVFLFRTTQVFKESSLERGLSMPRIGMWENLKVSANGF